jgi:hypothetical protein
MSDVTVLLFCIVLLYRGQLTESPKSKVGLSRPIGQLFGGAAEVKEYDKPIRNKI